MFDFLVRIDGTSNFKGFLIQAFDDFGNRVGSFNDRQTTDSQVMGCGGVANVSNFIILGFKLGFISIFSFIFYLNLNFV